MSRSSWWTPAQVSTGNVFTPRVNVLELSFEDPPRVLQEGPVQEWRMRIRKSRNGPDPVVRLDLIDTDGTILATPIDEEVVSSTDPIVLDGLWDAMVLPAASGVSVEARFTSINEKGTTRVDLGALQWQPIMESSVAAFLIPRWDVRTNVVSAPLDLRWDTRNNVTSNSLNLRWGTEVSVPTWSSTTTTFDSTTVTFASGALVPQGALVPNDSMVPGG